MWDSHNLCDWRGYLGNIDYMWWLKCCARFLHSGEITSVVCRYLGWPKMQIIPPGQQGIQDGKGHGCDEIQEIRGACTEQRGIQDYAFRNSEMPL